VDADILEWLDNTTRVPGILKFAREFIKDFRELKTPPFHDILLRKILFQYSTAKKNKFDRQLGLVGFRGSAKTTLDTLLLPLYNIIFKGFPSLLKYDGQIHDLNIGEDFIVIASKVGYMATQRLMVLRNNLVGNPKLVERFGVLKPRQIREGTTNVWRQDLFYCLSPDWGDNFERGTHLLGLGAGQMIRGQNLGDRVTLLLADDIYSLENVITMERRQRIDEWFYTEAIGSVDDLRGRVIFLGTIVHEDTVPMKIRNESKQRNPQWQYYEFPAMDPEEFTRCLNRVNYDIATGRFEMPDDKVIMGWQADCKTIAWPEKIDLKYLFNVFRSNLQGRTLDYIYREYLNVIQAPENRCFFPEMFVKRAITFERKDNINWIRVEGEEEWHTANIYFGIDLASSSKSGSDDTVIIIDAILDDGRLIALQYTYGKMGQRDDLYEKTLIDTFRHLPNEIRKRGVVDESLRLYEVYYPVLVTIETTSEQLKTFQEVLRVARNHNIPIRVKEYKPATDKHERIIHTLIGYYQTGSAIHQPGMSELEYQLEKLGKAAHDDIADAHHMAVLFARRPGKVERKESKKKEALVPVRDWKQWICY
jgi:hypothetical protein